MTERHTLHLERLYLLRPRQHPGGGVPATREEKVSFKQLRAGDLSPVKYKKVAEADEKEVPSAEIVKGFEHSKGKFVVLKDEDFDRVKIESTHSIEITDFVELALINPKFFYKPYFPEAQKGGEKGYSLLHRALVETEMVGIAKVAIKSREYLAAVKPDGLFLILELMHFAQEVLDPDELKSADSSQVSDRELQMAKTLIDALTAEWQPEKYEDKYQTALRQMIEAKVQNRPAEAVAAKGPAPVVGDIIAILEQSLRGVAEKMPRPVRATRPRSKPTVPSATIVVGKKR